MQVTSLFLQLFNLTSPLLLNWSFVNHSRWKLENLENGFQWPNFQSNQCIKIVYYCIHNDNYSYLLSEVFVPISLYLFTPSKRTKKGSMSTIASTIYCIQNVRNSKKLYWMQMWSLKIEISNHHALRKWFLWPSLFF